MKKLLFLSLVLAMSIATSFAQTNVVTIDQTNKALLISNDLSTDRAVEVIPGLQIARVYVIDATTSKIGIKTVDGRETTVTLTRLSNSSYSAGGAAAITAFMSDLMNIMSPSTDNYSTVTASNAVSSATTLDETYAFVKADATSAAFTITLPPAANAPRQRYVFTKIDATANDLTIDGNASETIDGVTTALLRGQWSTVVIISDGTNWFIESQNQNKISTKTTTYTVTAADGTIICDGTAGIFTVTLPTAVGCEGRIYRFKSIHANDITIDGAGSETIDGSAAYTLETIYDWVTIQSNGANWYVLSGN